MSKHISNFFLETKFTPEEFAWADAITGFCDMVAFDFSFEKPIKRFMTVYPNVDAMEMIEIVYEIKAGGKVVVSPWPFSVESIQGILVGYREEGYPDVLNPEIVGFDIRAS